jgi:hypothetical protein
MNKVEIVNIALGGAGVITGITGTVLGICNSRSIKKLAPLESRMSVVENNVGALLSPAPAAQPQQQAAPQNQQAQ